MKKIKQQYRIRIQLYGVSGYSRDRVVYPLVRSGPHKRFSTKQETSYYFLHIIECKGYSVKFRVARGKGLPNPWGDYPSYVDKVAKSWKHISKRRKQYF
ncbi:hypothetical protein Shal_1978 [Shewanella halifaxensis HAW-EB4]|uniref:Uncharacterized protein n=1 Tax=Shewanella halifaxensis (strain HAW-EB4) TaxID=458817 RepID=B0TSG2_SHEHH|nr:hypothetical protein [Shewanella halifaxensis]ABZ76542.1 hypothetical protein Shal_1978 [Shewanella halifaxensis HAW-EB4]